MSEFDLFNGREERMKAAIQEITASKESLMQFMQESGIYDENGHLAPMYR